MQNKTVYIDEKTEKNVILRRLKEYRVRFGLGCLDAVVKAARSPDTINHLLLLNLVTDNFPRMPIENWRKIGGALDRLEGKA